MLVGVRIDEWKREYPGWVSHLLKCLTVFAESPVVLSPLETSWISHEPETTMHREMEDEAGAGAMGKHSWTLLALHPGFQTWVL